MRYALLLLLVCCTFASAATNPIVPDQIISTPDPIGTPGTCFIPLGSGWTIEVIQPGAYGTTVPEKVISNPTTGETTFTGTITYTPISNAALDGQVDTVIAQVRTPENTVGVFTITVTIGFAVVQPTITPKVSKISTMPGISTSGDPVTQVFYTTPNRYSVDHPNIATTPLRVFSARGTHQGTLTFTQETATIFSYRYTPLSAVSNSGYDEQVLVRTTAVDTSVFGFADATLTIHVTAPSEIRPRIISRPRDEEILFGDTWTYQLTVDSAALPPSGHLNRYDIIEGPSGVSVLQDSGNQATVSFHPTMSQIGFHALAVKVTDTVSNTCDIQQVVIYVRSIAAVN